MKKSIIIIGIVVVVGGVFYWTQNFLQKMESVVAKDYKNSSYAVENKTIQLNNGVFETKVAQDSAQVITTKYFGNEAKRDFNNDGMEDVAFILTQSGAGTGVFYYVVVALQTADGYKGTNAILLGDRIAPQTTEFRDGQIIVNYADRKSGEPFTTRPSMGVSRYFKVVGDALVEVKK